MNFIEACEKMDQGHVVLSDVSNKLYKIKKSCLFANGVKVSVDYLSSEEAKGTWSLIPNTDYNFVELSEEEANNLIKNLVLKER